jgi:hypothetical protein
LQPSGGYRGAREREPRWSAIAALCSPCSTGGIELAIEQATAALGDKDAVAHLRFCVNR